ncbi:MAG TPA: hypothetical protein PKD90_17245, partial [Phnomibacter sp.]|nr:hypothetical protein [Phnomibacter sp.]
RLTAEEYHLHGDPAIVMYSLSKPDFIMDSSYISLPENINLNNDSVLVKVKYFNQGKAILDTITVRITRTLPNGSVQTLYQAKQKAPGFEGNVTTRFAVRGLDEAGLNTLHIAIDTDDDVEEVNENNNEATYSFTIADQGVKPVYPLPFAIVNEWPITLWGNTVDPVAPPANYTLQVDTTAQFNSSALWSVAITNTTGLMSGQPTFTPTDGRTYYWRFIKEGGAPSNYPWNSFTYLPTETNGFNTQHYYQLAQSKFTSLLLDSTSRRLLFVPKENNLYITHGIYPTSATEDLHLSITMNGVSPIYSASVGRSIIFNVFDPISFKPWLNTTGRFGSGINAGAGREFNFEFQYYPASNRKKMMDFLDSIPTGHFVTARLVLDPDPGQPSFVNGGKADSAYAQYWKRDTTLYGSGKSLYHKLVQQGFAELDSMNIRRTFSFAFRKNDPVSFTPSYVLSEGLYDRPI